MAVTFKPVKHAFILDPKKADDFLNNKESSARKALERFYAHHPEEKKDFPLGANKNE